MHFTSRFQERVGNKRPSPHHPQSYGKAEAGVKMIKNMILKCISSKGDQDEALLELNNTPRQDTGSCGNSVWKKSKNNTAWWSKKTKNES